MSEAFDAAIAITLSEEGGFQNKREDPGNWTGGKVGVGELKGTNWGISAASYPTEDIEHMPRERAVTIYERHFWNAAWDALPKALAVALFDAGVNQQHPPDAWLQQALGVTQDGKIGPKTVAAAAVNPGLTLRNFMALRFVHYGLNPDFKLFGSDWSKRTLDLYRVCLAML